MCIWCLNESASLLTAFIAAQAFLLSQWLNVYCLYCFLKSILLFQNRSEVTVRGYLLCCWPLFIIVICAFCFLFQVKNTCRGGRVLFGSFSNRSPSTSGHILKGNPRLRFHHFDSVSTFIFTTHLSNHGAKNWLPNEKWFIQMEGCFGAILPCLNITDSFFVYYLTVKDTHQGVVWDFFSSL